MQNRATSFLQKILSTQNKEATIFGVSYVLHSTCCHLYGSVRVNRRGDTSPGKGTKNGTIPIKGPRGRTNTCKGPTGGTGRGKGPRFGPISCKEISRPSVTENQDGHRTRSGFKRQPGRNYRWPTINHNSPPTWMYVPHVWYPYAHLDVRLGRARTTRRPTRVSTSRNPRRRGYCVVKIWGAAVT